MIRLAWLFAVDTAKPCLRTRLPPTVIQEDGPVPPPGPPPPGPPGEPREWWQWLLLALVVLAIVAGLAAYFATRGEEKNVVVPKVVGMTQAAAETRLHGVKLETKASHEFNSKPVGIVVAQSPGGGTQTGTGDVVALTVSKGPHAVAVPNTVSLTEADAVAQLTDAGLEADVVQVPSNARAGTVVAQNPKGGTSVDPGSTVRLNVSKGRTQTTTVTTTTQTTATATTHDRDDDDARHDDDGHDDANDDDTTAQASVPDVVGSTLSSAVAQMRAREAPGRLLSRRLRRGWRDGRRRRTRWPGRTSTRARSSA